MSGNGEAPKKEQGKPKGKPKKAAAAAAAAENSGAPPAPVNLVPAAAAAANAALPAAAAAAPFVAPPLPAANSGAGAAPLLGGGANSGPAVGPLAQLQFPSGLVNARAPKYVNRPIANILRNFKQVPRATNFKLTNSPVAVPPRPIPFLRPPSPTKLSRNITRYLGVGDAVENTRLIKELMNELLLMDLGSPLISNGHALDYSIYHRPSHAVMEEALVVEGSQGTEHFPITKGDKHLTALMLITDSGSIAYVKCGREWYTANTKTGILESHLSGILNWSNVKGSKFAVCFYSLLPLINRHSYGEGTVIFSGRNHTQVSPATAAQAAAVAAPIAAGAVAAAAASEAAVTENPLVGGGGGSAAAATAAATAPGGGRSKSAAAAVVQAELATPLTETSHIDSLCNVLCFASGFNEMFVTEHLNQQLALVTSIVDTRHNPPAFFSLFEILLGNEYVELRQRLVGSQTVNSVYNSFMTSKLAEINGTIYNLQASISQGEYLKSVLLQQKSQLEAQEASVLTTIVANPVAPATTYISQWGPEQWGRYDATQMLASIRGFALPQLNAELQYCQHHLDDYNRQLGTNQSYGRQITEKLSAIRSLQEGFNQRNAAAISTRRGLTNVNLPSLGPLGGVRLEGTGTICRALNFLTAMLFRLRLILSMPKVTSKKVTASKVRYSRRRQPRGKHGKYASVNKHSLTRRQASISRRRIRNERNRTVRAMRMGLPYEIAALAQIQDIGQLETAIHNLRVRGATTAKLAAQLAVQVARLERMKVNAAEAAKMNESNENAF